MNARQFRDKAPVGKNHPITSHEAAELGGARRLKESRWWVKRALTEGFPEGATDHEVRMWCQDKGAPYPLRSNRLASERGAMVKDGLVESTGERRPVGPRTTGMVWRWIGPSEDEVAEQASGDDMTGGDIRVQWS